MGMKILLYLEARKMVYGRLMKLSIKPDIPIAFDKITEISRTLGVSLLDFSNYSKNLDRTLRLKANLIVNPKLSI
jgi:hypothetical protein